MKNEIFIESLDLKFAIEAMLDLKKSHPKTYLSVILSRGKYYIEDGVPFIRVGETIVWSGLGKDFEAEKIKI